MDSGLQDKRSNRPSLQPTSQLNRPIEENRTNTSEVPDKISARATSSLVRDRAARRSLSGVPLTCLFETKFKHFKKFQNAERESRGLNFLLVNNSRAIYRSSMPVTPICTPSINRPLQFTEQTLHNRILETQRTFQPSALDSLQIKEENEPGGGIEDVRDRRHRGRDKNEKQPKSLSRTK